MKCKKHHLSDLTSAVGVCASCLRERLLALIAAQERAHLARVSSRAADDHPRKSDPNPPPPPPPLVFPRSVSPYVSRRKSDYHDHRHNSLFYSTPQVGPTFGGGGSATAANSAFAGRVRGSSYKKKLGSFWIFSGLFRSRSDKFEANHRVSSQESCEEASSSASSPSWFSMIFPSRHKHHHDRMGASSDDSTVRGRRHRHRQSDRGMSPVTTENFPAADDCNTDGYSTESSPPWRRTPSSAAPFCTRRSRHGRNVSVTGMAFCLSPLVRANPNPNPNRNPKGLPPAAETTAASVDIRGTPKQKPHISTASSFCANRSRKLADFGRTNQNR